MFDKKFNPALAQARTAIESHVRPEFQAPLASCIESGREILSKPELHELLMHQMATSHNPPKDAGAGATRMVYTLYEQGQNAGKPLPPEILVPAAMIFAFEYLDLVAKTTGLKITPELIGQVTTDTGDAMLLAMRVTPLMLLEIATMKSGMRTA